MRPVADAVMSGIALGLGLPATWFAEHLTADPDRAVPDLPLPAGRPDRDEWGVGEHTDYGLLTLLAQDRSRRPAGEGSRRRVDRRPTRSRAS